VSFFNYKIKKFKKQKIQKSKKKIKKKKTKILFLIFFLKKKRWVLGVALFPNRNPIFLTPLRSLSVCNDMMTNFIARLREFRFAIISSLISAELKLALL
jgi:hypothetical protein